MSAYLRKIIAGLNPNARTAILATADAENGRVPYAVHARTIDSLYGKRILRHVPNRQGGFDWFVLSALGKRVAAELAERAAARAAKAEPTKADRELQYANATQVFAALHPAAAEIVKAYQGNAIDTVVEGGPSFTPAQIWDQIGAEPGQRLTWNTGEDPDEWATAEGFNKAWAHLDRLATAVKLDMARRDDIVTEARAVMRTNSADREEPVVLIKESRSWQVVFAKTSTLTGENWADLPVVEVLRTARLKAGDDWYEVERRLAAAGLARYAVIASSAGHALTVARARWEAEGPHSAWFAFLRDEAPAIEAFTPASPITA